MNTLPNFSRAELAISSALKRDGAEPLLAPIFSWTGSTPPPLSPFPTPFSFASYAVIQREEKNCFCTSQFNLIISFLGWLAFCGS